MYSISQYAHFNLIRVESCGRAKPLRGGCRQILTFGFLVEMIRFLANTFCNILVSCSRDAARVLFSLMHCFVGPLALVRARPRNYIGGHVELHRYHTIFLVP
jgi:hypothetical protein